MTPHRVAPLVALALLFVGCVTIGRVESLNEPVCHRAFTGALASILEEQGETEEVATTLAAQTAFRLAAGGVGPRPFSVASPTGVDYSLFVQAKKGSCLLRLYGRQKGFVSYTNNATYIATRPLVGCGCPS
jgi:hypothetical protein